MGVSRADAWGRDPSGCKREEAWERRQTSRPEYGTEKKVEHRTQPAEIWTSLNRKLERGRIEGAPHAQGKILTHQERLGSSELQLREGDGGVGPCYPNPGRSSGLGVRRPLSSCPGLASLGQAEKPRSWWPQCSPPQR